MHALFTLALEDLPLSDFECPVCTAEQFAPLVVVDALGKEREAHGLFRCRSCGFCFADAAQYCRQRPKPAPR